MSLKTVGVAIGAATGLTAYLLNRRWSNMDCDHATYTSTLNPEYFRNRIIWITGASTGIGKALTYYIAALNVGVKLVLTARRDQLLNHIKSDITNSYSITNKDIYILPMDLNTNNKQYLTTKYATILDFFNVKSIDILINNAGSKKFVYIQTQIKIHIHILTVDEYSGFSMRSYLVDFDEQDAIDMMQTNLIAPVILTKLVLADIVKDADKHVDGKIDRFGHIVNIASVAARFYPPTRSVYVSTKVGLLGFTYAMDEEVKEYENVNITVILPGSVKSDVDIAAKGTFGKPHGKRDVGIQKGQDAMRCAEIIYTAGSNKILESWPANQPELGWMYKCYFTTPSKYDGREAVSKKLKEAAGYLPSKL